MSSQSEKKPDIGKIRNLIPRALAPDRRAARRILRQLTGKRQRKPALSKHQRQLDQLEARLRKSAAARQARIRKRPVPAFPPDLPITGRKDDIIAAIRRNPVVRE